MRARPDPAAKETQSLCCSQLLPLLSCNRAWDLGAGFAGWCETWGAARLECVRLLGDVKPLPGDAKPLSSDVKPLSGGVNPPSGDVKPLRYEAGVPAQDRSTTHERRSTQFCLPIPHADPLTKSRTVPPHIGDLTSVFPFFRFSVFPFFTHWRAHARVAVGIKSRPGSSSSKRPCNRGVPPPQATQDHARAHAQTATAHHTEERQ